MKKFILVSMFGVFLLVGCFSNAGKVGQDGNGGNVKENGTVASEDTGKTTGPAGKPSNQEECEKAGGVWGPVGLFPEAICNIKTADGGKVCSDADECEGSCLADLTQAEEDRVNSGTPVRKEGMCSEWTTLVGCLAFVEDGYVSQVLCAD